MIAGPMEPPFLLVSHTFFSSTTKTMNSGADSHAVETRHKRQWLEYELRLITCPVSTRGSLADITTALIKVVIAVVLRGQPSTTTFYFHSGIRLWVHLMRTLLPRVRRSHRIEGALWLKMLCDDFLLERHSSGLERWVVSQEHLLLFQRVRFQYRSGSSQPPVTPVSGDLTPSSDLLWHLHIWLLLLLLF